MNKNAISLSSLKRETKFAVILSRDELEELFRHQALLCEKNETDMSI